jgi:dipeptidyl-peptidase III
MTRLLALKGHLFTVIGFIAMVLVYQPGMLQAQRPGPDVQVDEFLFPTEGALEPNLALLKQQVEQGADAAVQALYGIQLLAGGDYAQARSYCSEALSRSTLFEPLYCMSMIRFAEGDLGPAAELASRAIEVRPNSVAPYIVLANVRRTLKDKEGMAKAIEMGIVSMPDRADFWEWELAKLFEQMGDLDGALQCIGVLSRINAQDPKVFTQAGDWLRTRGRPSEAAQMYRFALTKATWYQPAALALVETWRDNSMWSDLHQAVPVLLDNPQLAPIHETLAHYLDEANRALLKQELTALETRHNIPFVDLARFEEVDPGIALEILLSGALAYRRFKQPEGALTLLRKATSIDPGDTEVLYHMAELLLEQEEVDLAASFIKEAIQGQQTPETYFVAARIRQRQGKAKECLESLEKVLDVRPDWLDAILHQALCHRMLRHTGKELDALKKAHRVDPEDSLALTELARYYLHMKNGKEEAAIYLERLFSLEPYDYRICEKLSELHMKNRRSRDALLVTLECYAAIPPYRADQRRSTHERAEKLISSIKRSDVTLSAWSSLCESGSDEACIEVEALTRTGHRKVALRKQGYQLRKKRKALTGELERLGPDGGDFVVLGLDAPGFSELPRDEKIFLYYMSRAAIAGNDLLYLQNHRHSYLLKRLLETLFAYRKYLPASTVDGLHKYLKYVWINHGNYDHRSGLKFVPDLLLEPALKEAMRTVYSRGEKLSFIPGNSVDEKFALVQQTIFDKDFEPMLTVTGKGKDIIAESAVNHYDPGITEAALEALPKEDLNALNVRFVLLGGKIIMRKYMIGGLGSPWLERVVHFLEAALPYAQSPEQTASINALVRFYRTGDEDAFRRHSIAWLKTRGVTDFINGFVEQLKDPRGVIGNFEGMSAFNADVTLVERLSDSAGYFETVMPWPDKYKRKKVNRPVSNVATVLVGTGDMGPVPWAGYNLPNYADIRSQTGSKNVIFVNIMTARSDKEKDAMIKEFYLPEYQSLVSKYGRLVTNWNVYMHEIIGHGSGCPDESLKDDPRTVIGRSFSALEEARADLVALYFMADPKLVEIGAFPAAEAERILLASYAQYFQSFLTLYRRFHGGVINEAHWKGRQMILNYLLAGGEDGKGDYGIRFVMEDGNVYVKIDEALKVRAGITALLKRVQIIKSTGDAKAAEELLDRFGSRYDEGMQKNIQDRAAKIGLARQSAFVFPRLEPVSDRSGKIVDVRIHNDEDITAQQLRYSRLQESTDLE